MSGGEIGVVWLWTVDVMRVRKRAFLCVYFEHVGMYVYTCIGATVVCRGGKEKCCYYHCVKITQQPIFLMTWPGLRSYVIYVYTICVCFHIFQTLGI